MRPGKKPISCMPCAKRKVRCDKGQPCSNCRRRRGDICTYPGQHLSAGDGHSEKNLQYIQKLKSHIRSLGGDPNSAEQNFKYSHSGTQEASIHGRPDTTSQPEGVASTNQPGDNSIAPKEARSLIGRQGSLAEHSGQVTYNEVYVTVQMVVFLSTILTVSIQANVVHLEWRRT
jgi:hypothetical protein